MRAPIGPWLDRRSEPVSCGSPRRMKMSLERLQQEPVSPAPDPVALFRDSGSGAGLAGSALMVMSCMLFGLASLGAVARAPTFSADLVTRKVGVQPNGQGRVYVSGGKVRIETPGFADGFFIVDVDGDRGDAWFVQPQRWLVMEARQS